MRKAPFERALDRSHSPWASLYREIVRFFPQSLTAAALLIAFGVIQSVLSSNELAAVPPTTTPETPLTNALTFVGFAISIATFGLLGRYVTRSGGSLGQAAGAGALSGLLVGFGVVALQLLFFRDYVRVSLSMAGLPEGFADVVLIVSLIFYPLLYCGFGALISWLAGIISRPRTTAHRELV